MPARRIPVNAAALLTGRVASAMVALLVIALAAHRLDVAEFGVMVSTMAAGFLANTLVTFGTDTVITRAVAAAREDRAAVVRASLLLQVSGAAVIVGAAVVALLVGASAGVPLLVQSVVLIPLAVVTVMGAVLRGEQRMDLLLVGMILGAVTGLVAVVLLFSRFEAAWVPIAGLGIGSTMTAVVLYLFAGTLMSNVASPAVPVRTLVSETAPFAAMVILAAIGAQVGLLLVEFAADEPTGGYGVAVRLSEAARLVPASVMGAFFPAMMSGLHRTDRYRRWTGWLVGYALVITVVLVATADLINRVVFDDQPNGAPLIRILSLGLVITVARLALSFELIADGRERTVLVSALVGAAVTLGGGLAVAQTFGAQGVAWCQLGGLFCAVAILAAKRSAAAPESATAAVGVREIDPRHR